jgi:hypothetical protein
MVGTEWIEIRKNMPDLEGKSAEIECKQSLLPWNFEREWYCGSESEKIPGFFLENGTGARRKRELKHGQRRGPSSSLYHGKNAEVITSNIQIGQLHTPMEARVRVVSKLMVAR